MVAINTLTATGSLPAHTGGSAVRQSAPVAKDDGSHAEPPATIVTLSDRAQQLMAEAKAADAVADVFAITNGLAPVDDATASTRVLVAHDAQTNEGLYIVWSSTG